MSALARCARENDRRAECDGYLGGTRFSASADDLEVVPPTAPSPGGRRLPHLGGCLRSGRRGGRRWRGVEAFLRGSRDGERLAVGPFDEETAERGLVGDVHLLARAGDHFEAGAEG